MSEIKTIDIFTDLQEQVRDAGLLERVPVRGILEMLAIIASLILVFTTMEMWNPFFMGLFMTLIFTRSVFVSHDILHLQYFKNKKLSMILSHPMQHH